MVLGVTMTPGLWRERDPVALTAPRNRPPKSWGMSLGAHSWGWVEGCGRRHFSKRGLQILSFNDPSVLFLLE